MENQQSTGLKPTGRVAFEITTVMVMLTTIAIGLRGIVKARARVPFIASDWVILGAYINFCVHSGVFMGGTGFKSQLTVSI